MTILLSLSRGEKVEDICKTMTVEGISQYYCFLFTDLFPNSCHSKGVPTAKVAVEFASRCGLDLPIFHAVALILSGDLLIEVIFKIYVFLFQY